MIIGIDYCPPLDHLVDFFGPGGLAQALLKDDTGLVTFRACCRRFLRHWSRRQTNSFSNFRRLLKRPPKSGGGRQRKKDKESAPGSFGEIALQFIRHGS